MKLVVIFSSFSLLVHCVSGQCLNVNWKSSTISSPPFQDKNTNHPLSASPAVQAIITTYRFTCDCAITSWEAYVETGAAQHQNGAYDISFQVWRPSPTVSEDGCYSLVGENSYSSITYSGGGTVSVSIDPPYIVAQAEDVIGYYTNFRFDSNQGIQLEDHHHFERNLIWYLPFSTTDNIAQNNTNCPFPVSSGSNRVLTSSKNAAPAIRIGTSMIQHLNTEPMSASIQSTSALSSTPSASMSLFSSFEVLSTSSASDSGYLSVVNFTSYVNFTRSVSQSLNFFNSNMDTKSTGKLTWPITISAIVTITLAVISLLVVSLIFLLNRKKFMHTYGTDVTLANPNYELSVRYAKKHEVRKKSVEESKMIPCTKVTVSDHSYCNKKDLQYTRIGKVTDVLEEVSVLSKKRKNSCDEIVCHQETNMDENGYHELEQHSALEIETMNAFAVPLIAASESKASEKSVYHELESNQCFSQDQENTCCALEVRADCVLVRYEDKPYHELEESRYCGVSSNPVKPIQHRLGSHSEFEPPESWNGEGFHNNAGELGEDVLCWDQEQESQATFENGGRRHSYAALESIEECGMFDTVGYYVPTQEERSEYGLANDKYEKQMQKNKSMETRFFVEDEVYWTPATTAPAIYSQLSSKRYREVPRCQIRLKNFLGSGQFGEVFRATWKVDKHELDLAVKTLKQGTSEEDKVKFLQEAAIMGQFSHANVIKMYGVVTLGEPIYICLELLEKGDLQQYLQNLKLKGKKRKYFKDTQKMFLKFAKDIAAAMSYLSQKRFIHRDLAARNILLNKNLICKVSDFGMARDLMDDTYYTSSGGKIPIKWTAPEALLYKKYSSSSDVWSYGMVLFEIWSVGKKPFSTSTNSEVMHLLQTGYCQAPPPGCPRAIYEIMVDCWNPDYKSRPTFTSLFKPILNQSPAKLLHWNVEDNRLSPTAGICGGPLEQSSNLYPDLQIRHTKKKGEMFTFI